jgi:ATP-dependent RNA helicase SUPV3L1/SUV3
MAAAEASESRGQQISEQTNELADQQTNELAASSEHQQTNGEAAGAAAMSEAALAQAAEPELIEVWRPGRFDRTARGPRRHERQDGRRSHRGPSPADAPAAGTGDTEQVAAKSDDAAPERRPHRHRPERPRRPERPHHGGDRPEHGDRRAERPDRGERGSRPPRAGRFDRPRSEGGKSFNQSVPPQRREREPDPNSPFAKLAALKAQLEAGAKEPR